MRSLLELGHLESLESAAQSFASCIEARKFFEPEAFAMWCRRILVDHPSKQALILPPGTVVEGDLFLDGDAGLSLDGEPDDPALASVATILALGSLTIHGSVINVSTDNGDFLLVGGDLHTHAVIKGAASIVVLGTLTSQSAIFCDYCAGALVTGGDVTAPLVISNDHDLTIGGTLNGLLISSELGNMRASLVADVFADPNDPDDEWPDGALVRAQIDAGLPLLRSDAA